MGFVSLLASNAVLSALSISNLGLISSMVGFLHHEKDNVHTYQVNWPGNTVQLAVEPKKLWVDQGHTSNGVAGYGFFLGLFGIFVAWWLRKHHTRSVRLPIIGNRSFLTCLQTPSRLLLTLVILHFLAVLFTLSAIIFVFLVTNQTKGQHISEAIARSNVPYPADKWTPETWFKAVRDLPISKHEHDRISSKITNMVAWRWILIPIFLTDIAAFSASAFEYFKQRRGEFGSKNARAGGFEEK
ncbi:hypothetical protein BDV96DRAFT_495181 [Lophiotrema nucula]|uniref:Uncharacterized protein n=1 Tax=Lophiotrema nucula TaxID=690887 RepID=A0A6A5Z3A2_9PLEO|nr:hypothetical protein BDV96DRAFT_495181 [Lophiotrema nucula]